MWHTSVPAVLLSEILDPPGEQNFSVPPCDRHPVSISIFLENSKLSLPEISSGLGRISLFESLLDKALTRLIPPFPGRFHLQDIFQPILFFQAFMNFEPGARGIFAHFAFSIL